VRNFFCGLSYDAVSIWVIQHHMGDEWYVGKVLFVGGCDLTEVLSWDLHSHTEENHKDLGHYSQCSG
jgi:hypothetical protein